MYLCDDLNIITFIVGDDKPSIYRWRGANTDLNESVFTKTNFIHKKLTQNHRSHRQIQDYSNMLLAETNNLVSNPDNSGNILWVLSTNADWAATVIPLLQADKTSALLRSQRDYSPNTEQATVRIHLPLMDFPALSFHQLRLMISRRTSILNIN